VLAVADGYGWAGGAYLAENQQAVVQSRLRTVAVREIMTADPVADLLPRLNACSDGRALVFADGQLAGIVAPADISQALERISS
jgi:CBS-domain-containing membrane protein